MCLLSHFFGEGSRGHWIFLASHRHPPHPPKLSTPETRKGVCKPLKAAPVVTATHNRLHSHWAGGKGGERQLWADQSSLWGVPGPKPPAYAPFQVLHAPLQSFEEKAFLKARHHSLPGAACLQRVPVVHVLSSNLGVRLGGRS